MLPLVQAPVRHGLLPADPDPDTATYWQGLAESRLLLPRCRECGRVWSPPTGNCPHCGTGDPVWIEHDGRGRVYSWITVHRALDPAFAEDVPYVVAVVTLDGADGARLLGRVLPDETAGADGDLPQVAADLPVQTVAYHVAGRALPGFTIAGSRSSQKGVP